MTTVLQSLRAINGLLQRQIAKMLNLEQITAQSPALCRAAKTLTVLYPFLLQMTLQETLRIFACINVANKTSGYRRASAWASPSGNSLISNLDNVSAPFFSPFCCLFWRPSTKPSEPPSIYLRPRLAPSACCLGWLSATHADMNDSGQL